MSRTKLLLIIIALMTIGTACFNLWLSPLPSPADVRSLLQHVSMPPISDAAGNSADPIYDAAVQVDVVDTSVDVITTYAGPQGFGSGRLKRTLFGWDVQGSSWGPFSAFTSARTLSYAYDQEFDYTDFRNTQSFRSAELLWGFRRMPQAQSLIITYSNGMKINHVMTQDFFSVVSDTNGVMCSVEVADGHGHRLEVLPLEPRQPAWVRAPKAVCL